MTTQNEERRESSSFARLLSAGVIGFMFGAGCAIATHLDGTGQESRLAIPAVPAATAESDYFPAQYVNQAKEAEEHIQAF